MKTLLWLKKTGAAACVIYTVLITGTYLLGAAVDARWLPTPATVLSLLAFSFALAASFSFLFSGLLSAPVRVILHFLAVLAAYIFIFLVWSGYLKDGGSLLTGVLVYVFVYLLIGAAVFLIRRLTGTRENREQAYESIFTADGTQAPRGRRS